MRDNKNTIPQDNSVNVGAPTACTVRRVECFEPKAIGEQLSVDDLNRDETIFLQKLVSTGSLPLAQFVMLSAENPNFKKVSLSPVYIKNTNDSFEQLQAMGTMLDKLEQKGYIVLNFGNQLKDYDYSDYINSDVFALYKDMVANISTNQAAFTGDTTVVEKGSMTATEACVKLLK